MINTVFSLKNTKQELIVKLALVFFLSLLSTKLEAASSKIIDFKLTACNLNHCIKLTSPVASTSFIDPSLIVLEQAQLELFDKTGTNKLKSFKSLDGSVDIQIQRISLKNLTSDTSKDLSYNLKSGSYSFFSKTISQNSN